MASYLWGCRAWSQAQFWILRVFGSSCSEHRSSAVRLTVSIKSNLSLYLGSNESDLSSFDHTSFSQPRVCYLRVIFSGFRFWGRWSSPLSPAFPSGARLSHLAQCACCCWTARAAPQIRYQSMHLVQIYQNNAKLRCRTRQYDTIQYILRSPFSRFSQWEFPCRCEPCHWDLASTSAAPQAQSPVVISELANTGLSR